MENFLTRMMAPMAMVVFSPSDGGAGAAALAGGEGGEGGEGAGEGGGAGAGEGGDPWYETHEWKDPALKEHLIGAGYHKGDLPAALEAALRGNLEVNKKLGDKASLIEGPKEGQSVADYVAAHPDRFGIPSEGKDYGLTLPENLPSDAGLNEAMLNAYADKVAGKLPKEHAELSMQAYAEVLSSVAEQEQQQLDADRKSMSDTLRSDWGGDYDKNVASAKQAFSVVMKNIGFEGDAGKVLANQLNDGLGSAGLLKMFHHISTAMAEDVLLTPSGEGAPSGQRASDDMRRNQIKGDGEGSINAALRKNDQRTVKRLQTELNEINARRANK